ncbi:uncharacterized protein METZ01_LOCUS171573, partial [marine metagenome]
VSKVYDLSRDVCECLPVSIQKITRLGSEVIFKVYAGLLFSGDKLSLHPKHFLDQFLLSGHLVTP